MVQLNCEALVELQARYTPAMVERGRGAVINIASMAAFQPIPGHGNLRRDEGVRSRPFGGNAQ